MSNVGAGDDDISPYELLEVGIEATEQEIKTSYRKRSLKVHPDRNPNNPDAARKFHELNQAYELLLDPLRRLALDAKLRLKNARKERFKAYDTKRKNLVEELEEREKAFKKARVEKAQEEARVRYETEHIKDQGRKLVEERERKLREAERAEREAKEREQAAVRRMAEDDEPPALDQFDTTVRLKYTLKRHGDLTSKEEIAAFLAPFGAVDVDSIVFSMKAKKSKKSGESSAAPTHATALVPFKTIGDAYAAVCASSAPVTSPLSRKVNMKGMEIGWVNGQEPAILGWLKKMGKLSEGTEEKSDMASPPPPESRAESNTVPTGTGTPSFSFATEDDNPKGSTPFSSFPDMDSTPHPAASTAPSFSFSTAPGMDYEGLTLLRMRQAERERLEREILENEKEEEGES